MTDLTDGATDATAAAEADAAAMTRVRTAKGDAEYNADWNGIGSSDDPTLATLRLLHSARQMVDTSRWWTLRWPNSAISLLGTACGLNTEGTCGALPVVGSGNRSASCFSIGRFEQPKAMQKSLIHQQSCVHHARGPAGC